MFSAAHHLVGSQVPAPAATAHVGHRIHHGGVELQFHERCARVVGRDGRVDDVAVAGIAPLR